MPPAANFVATADARNPKDVTATGLGAVVTGVPGVTATGLAAGTGAPGVTATGLAAGTGAPGVTATGLAAGTGAPGRPLPGRPDSCQALTSKAMAATTRSAQATGSRTRRTLSHACAVSDGTSSPS